MAMLLPLALICAGLFYFLFVAASLALPLLAAFSAAVAAIQAGLPAGSAIAVGICTFMAVVAVSRLAAEMLPTARARGAILLLFALPAAWFAFEATDHIARLFGAADWRAAGAVIAALAVGYHAASRHLGLGRR
ncbi:MAG: hypothetical protein JWR80_9687 [Bradyrhizobium sp.]|nr:hypothetical protein [Bradyrhizobium sp.]